MIKLYKYKQGIEPRIGWSKYIVVWQTKDRNLTYPELIVRIKDSKRTSIIKCPKCRNNISDTIGHGENIDVYCLNCLLSFGVHSVGEFQNIDDDHLKTCTLEDSEYMIDEFNESR